MIFGHSEKFSSPFERVQLCNYEYQKNKIVYIMTFHVGFWTKLLKQEVQIPNEFQIFNFQTKTISQNSKSFVHFSVRFKH